MHQLIGRLESDFPGEDGPVDLLAQPDVRLFLCVQEVEGVLDVGRVEPLLHQPHLPHLEGARHFQAGLQNAQLSTVFVTSPEARSGFLSSHLNPEESRSCVRWEVVDHVRVDVRTIEIFSFFQHERCHADPPFVAWPSSVSQLVNKSTGGRALQASAALASTVSPSTLTP